MIIRNSAKCRVCLDEIESKHQHDMVWCKGGHIFVDGGLEYIRRGGQRHNVIDTSKIKKEPRKLRPIEKAEKYKEYLDARG